jgi:tetratricopeptide (TPR) repeat protein
VTSATASPPPLDETTAIAIRQALAAAQTGLIAQACVTAEQALANGGDKVALNALLGMLRTRSNQHDAAIRHLEIARSGRPADARIAINLATALANTGEMARAFDVASAELAFADPSLQLARIRGFAADQLGNWTEAIGAYEHVVHAAPNDWESWNNLGNARLMAGDFARGIADLERAVAMAPDTAPLRLNVARAFQQAGDLQKAEDLLRKMADDFPNDAKPLFALHDILKVQVREEEILEVVDRALAIEPENVELLLARARHFGAMLEMDQGERAFRAVLARDPRNADAFVGLATLYEHSRPAALPEIAEEAERQTVDSNALNLVRAFAHRRANRYSDGIAALEQISPEFETARREHLLGQMLEGLGEYDAAYRAFERMNKVYCEDPSRPLERAEAKRAQIRRELATTTEAWLATWKSPPLEPERAAPVFLIGFPRSGTTLLDTILMGHPDVVVMEERPVIARLGSELGGFEAIATLTEAQVRHAQRRYFEIASEYADLGSGSLLVDKSPMLLNEAALIYRLFPNARFILALRHPADVLLSCFVSNFRLNNAMSNFIRLDTAAEFYDLTFSMWENARALLPLDVHTVVYEQMVENPPAALRPLVEGIGLEWHEDMLDHTKTAAERGMITTASYAQVTEPIYRRSVGRWLKYANHLEPIVPVLKPWAEKFGYTI